MPYLPTEALCPFIPVCTREMLLSTVLRSRCAVWLTLAAIVDVVAKTCTADGAGQRNDLIASGYPCAATLSLDQAYAGYCDLTAGINLYDASQGLGACDGPRGMLHANATDCTADFACATAFLPPRSHTYLHLLPRA